MVNDLCLFDHSESRCKEQRWRRIEIKGTKHPPAWIPAAETGLFQQSVNHLIMTSLDHFHGLLILKSLMLQAWYEMNGTRYDSKWNIISETNGLIDIDCYDWQGHAKELGSLVKVVRPFLKSISKAKAAKLVRTLVDLFLDMEASTGLEVNLLRHLPIFYRKPTASILVRKISYIL